MLRPGSDTSQIDGRDQTLLQVELPALVPLDIVVKLTAKFEEILLNQIRKLMTRHNHAITSSGQSGDVLSSDLSDDEDDTSTIADSQYSGNDSYTDSEA